jgi:hypothetical protein
MQKVIMPFIATNTGCETGKTNQEVIMKKLILAIMLMTSLSVQAKTLQERSVELTVLQQKIHLAEANKQTNWVCFLSGVFSEKIMELIEITSADGNPQNVAPYERMAKLMPIVEAKCSN